MYESIHPFCIWFFTSLFDQFWVWFFESSSHFKSIFFQVVLAPICVPFLIHFQLLFRVNATIFHVNLRLVFHHSTEFIFTVGFSEPAFHLLSMTRFISYLFIRLSGRNGLKMSEYSKKKQTLLPGFWEWRNAAATECGLLANWRPMEQLENGCKVDVFTELCRVSCQCLWLKLLITVHR